ncbi:MAG: hypothetical protein HMLKMBBP_00541 [Planctomycetes bacterium]|nr:hypothetical protein [Planctomycetota bacterium]
MTGEKKPLGKLESVELREYWEREDTQFTPWLAATDNIRLLADALGMEIEVQEEEARVGDFRADILARDASNNSVVLIENQLEQTDHTHLGQIMTYAAGLDALTVVWIARRFTEEHRAAIDWLNRITHDEIQFFGVEIELWRIGDSEPAPRFSVVAKPNDWSRTVRESAAAQGMTDADRKHVEFWTGFNAHLEATKSSLRRLAPSKTHWTNWGIGRSGFALQAVVGFRDGWASAGILILPPDAEAHLRLLELQAAEIEATLGAKVKWDFKPGRGQNYMSILREGLDLSDRARWPDVYAWLAKSLEAINACMRPRIAKLDASSWKPVEGAAAGVAPAPGA